MNPIRRPKRITKKSWPECFESLENGSKRFELRLADFDVNIGDLFVAKEYDLNTDTFSGRSLTFTVTYIFKFRGNIRSMRADDSPGPSFWTKAEQERHGFYILGLSAPITKGDKAK